MANFVRVRVPGGWASPLTVDDSEFELLDAQLVKAPNFTDGGTYAPSNPITVGGDGFILSGPLVANTYVAEFEAGLHSYVQTILSQSTTFDNGVVIFDGCSVDIDGSVVDVNNASTINVNTGGKIELETGGTFESKTGSTVKLNGIIDGSIDSGTLIFGNSSILRIASGGILDVLGELIGVVGGSGMLQFGALHTTRFLGILELNGGDMRVNRPLVLGNDIAGTAAGGTIAWRRTTVTGAATIDPYEWDEVYINHGAGASFTVTLTNLGATEGQRVRFTRPFGANGLYNAVNVNANGVPTFLIIGGAGANVPDWAELIFDGANWQYSAAGRHNLRTALRGRRPHLEAREKAALPGSAGGGERYPALRAVIRTVHVAPAAVVRVESGVDALPAACGEPERLARRGRGALPSGARVARCPRLPGRAPRAAASASLDGRAGLGLLRPALVAPAPRHHRHDQHQPEDAHPRSLPHRPPISSPRLLIPMPTPPYAKLLVSVNGGAPTSGAVDVPNGATIQLSAESTVGWFGQRWELPFLPPGWAAPAGWTYDAAQDVYFYELGVTPPVFSAPAPPEWGTILPVLKVKTTPTGGWIEDSDTGLRVLEPTYGLEEMAPREQNQLGGWAKKLRANLRIIAANLGGGGGGGGGVTSLRKAGAALLTGAITLTGVGLIELTQISQDISVKVADLGTTNVLLGHSGTGVATAGQITNAYVAAGAAIAGSKIAPDFGAQHIQTTGLATIGTIRWQDTGRTGLVKAIGGELDFIADAAVPIGAVLRMGGAGAAWGAVDLADSDAVTGTLPSANAPSHAGDVTGTHAASVVARINGATVPAAGALTTGNVLQVSGGSALSYGPINLAGGGAYVTGLLPLANLPQGAVRTVLQGTGASAPAYTATPTVDTLRIGTPGLIALTYPGSNMLQLGETGWTGGIAAVMASGAVFTVQHGSALSFTLWRSGGNVARCDVDAAATGVEYRQSPNTTAAATAVPTSIIAQNATGSGATVGGKLVLSSGLGATNGNIELQLGGTVAMVLTAAPASVASGECWEWNAAGTYKVAGYTGIDLCTGSTPTARISVTDSAVTLFGTTPSLGGGAGVVAIKPATTQPTSTPSGNGLLWAADTGNIVRYLTAAGGGETLGRRLDLGNKSASFAINWDDSRVQKATLTGSSIAITYTAGTVRPGAYYTLELAQDATGGRTFSFPGTDLWAVTTYIPAGYDTANRIMLFFGVGQADGTIHWLYCQYLRTL
jgi:hypothetical protein